MLNQRKDEKKCSKSIIWSIVAALFVSGLLFIGYLIYRTLCKPQCKPPPSSPNEVIPWWSVTHSHASRGTSEYQWQVHGSLIIVNGVQYQLQRTATTDLWLASSEKEDKKMIKEVGNKIFVYNLAEYEANTCFIDGIKEDCTVTVFDERSRDDKTFILESKLGAGSFGDVWKAHAKDGSRDVAIKFSKTLGGGIFKDESKVTKQIHQLLGDNGDKTVQCIGNVRTNYPKNKHKDASGKWIPNSRIMDVIVMELFDINAKNHFVKNQRGDQAEALEITKRITNVAQTMWNKGLIARDIKLQNIFLKVNDGKIESSAMGDHGIVIDKNKLTLKNLKHYFRSGTWLSPFDLLQFFGIGHDAKPKKLDIEEHREKLIQSDVVYDINMAVADMLLYKAAPEKLKVFHKLRTENKKKTQKLLEGRGEFWTIIEDSVRQINDREVFKEGDREISLEELMIWTFWASFKQIEDGGTEKYMITLDEYAKMIERVGPKHKNEDLNGKSYQNPNTFTKTNLNQRKDDNKCSKWVIWSIVAVSGLLFICCLIYKAQCKASTNEIEYVGVKAVSDEHQKFEKRGSFVDAEDSNIYQLGMCI